MKDVTTHPALRGGVQTLAHLYDLQWEKPDVTLFDSPTTGNKVARSFMMPQDACGAREHQPRDEGVGGLHATA